MSKQGWQDSSWWGMPSYLLLERTKCVKTWCKLLTIQISRLDLDTLRSDTCGPDTETQMRCPEATNHIDFTRPLTKNKKNTALTLFPLLSPSLSLYHMNYQRFVALGWECAHPVRCAQRDIKKVDTFNGNGNFFTSQYNWTIPIKMLIEFS